MRGSDTDRRSGTKISGREILIGATSRPNSCNNRFGVVRAAGKLKSPRDFPPRGMGIEIV